MLSYEILNNQDNIEKLIYKTNKFNILDKKLNNYLFNFLSRILNLLVL